MKTASGMMAVMREQQFEFKRLEQHLLDVWGQAIADAIDAEILADVYKAAEPYFVEWIPYVATDNDPCNDNPGRSSDTYEIQRSLFGNLSYLRNRDHMWDSLAYTLLS